MKSPHILIAGASGYIGKALIPYLLLKFPEARITALSRQSRPSSDPRVNWIDCDLFSLADLEQKISQDVDVAFYLVHSMGPTAHLDQGNFADYDLILADNFARVLSRRSIRHVVYLGGLVPEGQLSQHLESRLEVEKTFMQYQLPLTVFRAGLIIGPGGSSFQMLVKLVRRLPLMVCPSWTQTRTTPVDLASVILVLTSSVLEPDHIGKIYDLATCRPLSYIEMMRSTAERLRKRRVFIEVPFFSPTISRLWVSLFTSAPKDLVYPLIESLAHEMVARPQNMFPGLICDRDYDDLLEGMSLENELNSKQKRRQIRRNTVRSVQRIRLRARISAEQIVRLYIEWLPEFLRPLIKVDVSSTYVRFCLFHRRFVLLELRPNKGAESLNWVGLNVTGGWLASHGNQGFLEFRIVLGGEFVLAAIHDFRPALPWFIYKVTQAQLHLWIMKQFGRQILKNTAVPTREVLDQS